MLIEFLTEYHSERTCQIIVEIENHDFDKLQKLCLEFLNLVWETSYIEDKDECLDKIHKLEKVQTRQSDTIESIYRNYLNLVVHDVVKQGDKYINIDEFLTQKKYWKQPRVFSIEIR